MILGYDLPLQQYVNEAEREDGVEIEFYPSFARSKAASRFVFCTYYDRRTGTVQRKSGVSVEDLRRY